MRRPTLTLILWASIGVVVAVATYLLLVRLYDGQRLDFSAYEGRKWMSHTFRRTVTLLVHLGTPILVVLATAFCVVVAYLRRGAVAAVASAVAVLATVAITSGLKIELTRPGLLPGSWNTGDNTYPSGHLAVTAVVALVAVTVSPPAWRWWVTALGSVTIASMTLAVAATGWHRPSDLVGGLGVAIAVAGIASIPILRSWRGDRVPVRPQWWSRTDGVVVGAAAVLTLSMSWFFVGRLFGHRNYGDFGTHVAVVAVTVVVGYVATVVHCRLVAGGDAAVRR